MTSEVRYHFATQARHHGDLESDCQLYLQYDVVMHKKSRRVYLSAGVEIGAAFPSRKHGYLSLAFVGAIKGRSAFLCDKTKGPTSAEHSDVKIGAGWDGWE